MGARPGTALVLGAGGIAGGAWILGALRAIVAETGWDPSSADYVIGTSAGSMIGCLVASGIGLEQMVAYARGERVKSMMPQRRAREGEEPVFGTRMQVHWTFPRPVLGSPGLALRSLVQPWRYGPAGIVAWLPRGMVSTEPLERFVRRAVPSAWSAHPNLWITAVDYETGERVVFGRRGAPRAELSAAVAASCAIPGLYSPVEIGGRRYVDGGIYSSSNLELVLGTDAEMVVCLNPMSSRYRGGLLSPTGPIANLVRGNNRTRVDREARSLREAGKRVVLLEPHAEDIRVMGYNYMSGRRRGQIMDTAIRTTTAALRGSKLGRDLGSLRGTRAAQTGGFAGGLT